MTPIEDKILATANQCVKCGVCMPHCPTYQSTLDENESPRGRIALMQGLATHVLPLSQKLKQHLDQCLSCMACEAACPSHVEYGALIDDAQALIYKQQTPFIRYRSQLFLNALASRRMNFLFHLPLFLYQRSGLQTLIRKSGLLRLFKLDHLEATLPRLSKPIRFKSFYAAKGEKRGSVALFLGCLNPTFDTKTIQDALFVLTHLGFDVEVPPAQVCCGAIHLHSGNQAKSLSFETKNKKVFSKQYEAILMLGSGCAATAQSYAPLTGQAPYRELCEFITPYFTQTKSKNSPQTIFVHVPCTQRNVLRKKEAAFTLLEKLSGITLLPFSTETHCCGAAGTYMIRHRDIAQNLFLDLWEKRTKEEVNVIASNNIGCTLHFLAQLQTVGPHVQVLHPISIIRQAIEVL